MNMCLNLVTDSDLTCVNKTEFRKIGEQEPLNLSSLVTAAKVECPKNFFLQNYKDEINEVQEI